MARFLIPPLFTVLSLLSAAIVAQPDSGQQTQGENDTDTTVTEPEPRGESRRPADDYEASEQISEDLSVSFPVDI